MAVAFHRISRGVRQTAALRIRIAREAARAERDDQAEVVRLDEHRSARRKSQVKATVERLIWTEAESPDAAEGLIDDLEALLGEDELYGRLANGEVESHIVRLREDLGLARPADPGEGATPDPAGESCSGRSPAFISARGGNRPPPASPDPPFRSSG